jgi:hypothetical protein
VRCHEEAASGPAATGSENGTGKKPKPSAECGMRGDAMLDAGGGGGEMYTVQIESLEQFQQKLTVILQNLEQENSVMTMSEDGSGAFGKFPEAQDFSSAYEQAKQDLIDSFNEVTQLVNTMINVDKYKQTEQDITAKFNAILQQYGDTSTSTTSGTTTPSTSTNTHPTTVPTQNTGPTYATQSNAGTSTTTSTTSTTTSAGAA